VGYSVVLCLIAVLGIPLGTTSCLNKKCAREEDLPCEQVIPTQLCVLFTWYHIRAHFDCIRNDTFDFDKFETIYVLNSTARMSFVYAIMFMPALIKMNYKGPSFGWFCFVMLISSPILLLPYLATTYWGNIVSFAKLMKEKCRKFRLPSKNDLQKIVDLKIILFSKLTAAYKLI